MDDSKSLQRTGQKAEKQFNKRDTAALLSFCIFQHSAGDFPDIWKINK